ncbi:MAG: hypothetical protein V4687_19170 [Bacteroidota bacterium]
MIGFLYIVLLFLVLRFTVTLFNFLSNPKLGHYGRKFRDKITIIISGNEGECQELLDSIGLQDYENTEIIITGDRTADQVAFEAAGKYLVFLNKNAVVKKGLFNSMIYRMQVFNLTMLSVIPNRVFVNLTDRVLAPLSEYLLINLLPLRLVRLFATPAFSAVNTTCIIFNANIYKEHRWLAGVEDNGSIAFRLARTIKDKSLRTEILIANKLLYKQGGESTRAYSKQLCHALELSAFGALAFIVFALVGPLVLLIEFDKAFFTLPLGLIFLTRVMISFLTGQNPFINLLLHPIQMISLTYLLIVATYQKLIIARKHMQE